MLLRLSRTERYSLGLLFVIFTWFTWRGMTMFFSGDDMMNMYRSWDTNGWTLARAQLIISDPIYRPVGAAIYRIFYDVFGFFPRALYVFCWLLLAANFFIGYLFLRLVTANAIEALTALSLVLVHGNFSDLYYSAGTIYDRLCFLFTAAGCIAYFRFRRKPGWQTFALICLFAILDMGSKESGVALLPVLLCFELFFFAPAAYRSKSFRAWLPSWLRQIGPLFAVLIALSLIFVFARVHRTPELVTNSTYAPHASITIWLTRVSEYFGILAYRHIVFTMVRTSVALGVMAVAAIAARSRSMMFGWLFFVVSVTPVALITSRPGYVLYLPVVGLGIFFAAAITWLTAPLARVYPNTGVIAFLLVTIAIIWLHVRNWPTPWDPRLSPEARLTEQFRRDYPTLPPNSTLLFVSDEFPRTAWDLTFNLRMLYHDKSIVTYRLMAPADQHPDPMHPPVYDHIFAMESGHYVELDPLNPEESVRLNILRGYTIGQEMDMARADHSAYVVRGLQDSDIVQPSRWTDPKAQFKFRLQAEPTLFTTKFWVPDFVAAPANRTLSVLVNGQEIGNLLLSKSGMNEVRFPLPANLVHSSEYTLVDMNVSNPYKDAGGMEYGVVLLRAGFH